jgi:hypothetical protein
MLAAAIVVTGCGSGAGPRSAAGRDHQRQSGIPAALAREARPIGRGARFDPPARGPVPGACRPGLGPRVGVHVELFAADRVVLVPAAIGTRPPLRLAEGRISGARCYGALVTLEPTGVVLVRPGTRLNVADLFRAWGQPLSARRIASFTASGRRGVSVFVDGRRRRGAAGGVLLHPHSEIVLEIGPHVPPHAAYRFPPGS